ncbi:MAG: ECF-type sigma factor [Gemmatimonadota bacterium]
MAQNDTTSLLHRWGEGEREALDQLLPLVYDELKQIARGRLRRLVRGETLQTTVLVHEAYVKLVDGNRARVNDRAHFLAVASRAMRFILVDHARARSASKRGGDQRALPLDAVQVAQEDDRSRLDLVALDQALDTLSDLDPRLGQVVECRFFGGMEYAEIAEATGQSVVTVKRDWARARAWLYELMEGEAPGEG